MPSERGLFTSGAIEKPAGNDKMRVRVGGLHSALPASHTPTTTPPPPTTTTMATYTQSFERTEASLLAHTRRPFIPLGIPPAPAPGRRISVRPPTVADDGRMGPLLALDCLRLTRAQSDAEEEGRKEGLRFYDLADEEGFSRA